MLRGLAGRRGAVNAVLGWTGRLFGARLAAYHEVWQQRCEIHWLPLALRLQARVKPQDALIVLWRQWQSTKQCLFTVHR